MPGFVKQQNMVDINMAKEALVPRCNWATAGTLEDGSFAPPRACLAKKCNGGPFKKRPLCIYYHKEASSSINRECGKQVAALDEGAKERACMEKLKHGQEHTEE